MAALLSVFVVVLSFCGVSRGAKSPRVFSESYIEGVYGRFFEFSDEGNSAPCPQVIDHFNRGRPSALGESWIIPHANIVQSGAKCSDGGGLVVNAYNESSKMPKVLESNSIAEETFTLMQDESTGFWMGADERTCGKWVFPSRTYIFFVKEFDRTLTTSFRLTLSPGKKYMFVVADEFTCIYVDIPRKKPVTQVTITTPNDSSTGPSAGDESSSEEEPSNGVTPTPTPENLPDAGDASSTDGSQATDGSGSGVDDTDDDDSDASGDLSIVDIDNGQVPEETEEVNGGTIADIDTDDEEDSAEESSESFGIEVNNGESLCFPGDAQVEMADGSFKNMDELSVGDEVRVGNKFSRVFMFTHSKAETITRFLQLLTKSGRKLSLTSGHMLYVNGIIRAAEQVQVGDYLSLVDGIDQVVKISTVVKKGLFNPQTVHGDIVVNGLLTSTYTSAIDTKVAHSMLLPLRVIWNVFGVNLIPNYVNWSGIRSNLMALFSIVAMSKH
eukprot:TRINITY_DN823_c0_g1_i1.p1 TRINITY_DN823_c0_g1~~TRINITY_DN823_c0_g1_i1.p1  ORF type:complete len:498 (-),score=82.24 TRINITY_DN823_c0_g1_i1:991-2484(-)